MRAGVCRHVEHAGGTRLRAAAIARLSSLIVGIKPTRAFKVHCSTTCIRHRIACDTGNSVSGALQLQHRTAVELWATGRAWQVRGSCDRQPCLRRGSAPDRPAGGNVVTSNDAYQIPLPPPPAIPAPPTDLFLLLAEPFQIGPGIAHTLSGFDIGAFRLVNVRMFWIEPLQGAPDFLTNDALLAGLPTFAGRLVLDFVPISPIGAPPTAPTSFAFFDGLRVTRATLPAPQTLPLLVGALLVAGCWLLVAGCGLPWQGAPQLNRQVSRTVIAAEPTGQPARYLQSSAGCLLRSLSAG